MVLTGKIIFRRVITWLLFLSPGQRQVLKPKNSNSLRPTVGIKQEKLSKMPIIYYHSPVLNFRDTA